jgi:DNA-binding LytR/AlgR family response regulator
MLRFALEIAAIKNSKILIVEDEFFLADDLTRALRGAGAIIVGPTRTVDQTIKVLQDGTAIDAALVDINLRGELSFDVADILIEKKIPFIFVTGYDNGVMPERFQHVVRHEKPMDASVVVRHLADVIDQRDR